MFNQEHIFNKTVSVYDTDAISVKCTWKEMKQWIVKLKEWNYEKVFFNEEDAIEYTQLAEDYTSKYMKPEPKYTNLKQFKFVAMVEKDELILNYDEDTKSFEASQSVTHYIAYMNNQGNGFPDKVTNLDNLPKESSVIPYTEYDWAWFKETEKLNTLGMQATKTKIMELSGGKLIDFKTNEGVQVAYAPTTQNKGILSYWAIDLTNDPEIISKALFSFIPGKGFNLNKFLIGVLNKIEEHEIEIFKSGKDITDHMTPELVKLFAPYVQTTTSLKNGSVKVTVQFDERMVLAKNIWLDAGIYTYAPPDAFTKPVIELNNH